MNDDNNPPPDPASPEDPIDSDLVRQDPSFTEIVVEFVEGLDGRLKAMDEALRGNDLDALRAAAHRLKGSGGGYGYAILTERAAELERHAEAQSLEECTNVLEDLKKLCARVVVRGEQ